MTAEQLTAALTAVLNAIDAHEKKPPKRFVDEMEWPRVINAAASDAEWQRFGDDKFMSDPIGYGLRKSVRKIGRLLARDYPDQMHSIADRAAGAKRSNWNRRINIIDKNWDSLEMSNGDRWVA